MLHKCQIIFVGFFLLTGSVFAQNRQTIDSLKIAISKAEPDTNKLHLLNNLARQYDEIDRDSSVYYLNKSLHLSRELNNPKFKAMALTNLGADYCFMGEYFKSLEYLDLAENIIIEFPDKNTEAEIHYYKAIVYSSIDQLQKANKHALKSLMLNKELNNVVTVGSLYTIISGIYDDLGDKQMGFGFAEKAYLNALARKDTATIAANLNNLGARYHEIGNFDSAYSYMRKAIKLNKKNENLSWLAINYHNLAEYKFNEQVLDSASYYLNKALVLYNEIGYLMNIINSKELEAKIALAKKDTAESIRLYKSIINSSAEMGSLKIKVAAYKSLSEIKQEQGQLQEAIDYFKVYKIYNDSLREEKNTSLLTVMELQLEYEQKHSKLELENNEVKLNSQRKNFFLLTMAGLIFLLIISVYYVYRMQKAKAQSLRLEKKRIEDELEYKNREMTANVMSLMKKNEILKGISKKMLEVEKSAVKDETKKAIKTLSKEIQKSRDVELWDEFDIRFKQVHSGFYSNLMKQYPDLSPNEQKICAFLRMNMSTKDISDITGLGLKTIDNTRSNIRKKLNLDSSINLVSFLTKL